MAVTRTSKGERLSTTRWKAVLARAPEAESRFVYAVRTTGIFCRPTCPSVRPKRENVEFFARAEEAERAGYRACKRCRPGSSAPSPAVELLRAACDRLGADEEHGASAVAGALGVSESYLHRTFKRQLGITPRQYRQRVLAERARALLGAATSVTASIYEAGFASSSRFYAQVGPELGMSPAAARRGAPGEHIHYTLMRCTLGWLCIAWTARGICHVTIGAHGNELVTELRARFSRASCVREDAGVWAHAIAHGVEHSTSIDVPLDIRATAFQARVWEALRRIPRGETRSYGELARELGLPKGARAVATACAANTLAIVVPCHRVVRGSGDLAGYRWGLTRKERLLRDEAARRGP